MKKVIVSILSLFLFLAAGCDTTDTRTIKIGIGGSKGTPPPSDVTKAYIGIWTQNWNEETFDIDKMVFNKSVSATDLVTAVVPADRDLYIMVLAMNTSKTILYSGDAEHNVITDAIPGEPLPDVVSISMYENGISFAGLSFIDTSDNLNFTLYWNDGATGGFSPSYYIRRFMEMDIQRKFNDNVELEPDSFKTIARIPYNTFIFTNTYTDTHDTPMIPDGTAVWYRMGIYVPVFDLYIPTGSAYSSEYVAVP